MLDTKVGTKGFGRLVFLDIEFIVSDNDMKNQLKIEGFFLIRDGRLFLSIIFVAAFVCPASGCRMCIHPDVGLFDIRMWITVTPGCCKWEISMS